MLITISRQYGAGGSQVAQLVAEALGWRVVDNELVEEVAARAGLPPEQVAQREERCLSFVERLARSLAAATPDVFPPPGSAVAIADLSEAELVKITETVVEEIAARGKVVLVGRAAPAVLAREADALHVKLVAPRAFRLGIAMQRLGADAHRASSVLDDTD
ncbi:MAG TPA: cytidylate kinase-like family protein, partial [Gemmatimonadales bacterium]|nr:cytidylate kinase-like family protein [Gemmatimonadales bacterium]